VDNASEGVTREMRGILSTASQPRVSSAARMHWLMECGAGGAQRQALPNASVADPLPGYVACMARHYVINTFQAHSVSARRGTKAPMYIAKDKYREGPTLRLS
jgi:hypothetical protein